MFSNNKCVGSAHARARVCMCACTLKFHARACVHICMRARTSVCACVPVYELALIWTFIQEHFSDSLGPLVLLLLDSLSVVRNNIFHVTVESYLICYVSEGKSFWLCMCEFDKTAPYLEAFYFDELTGYGVVVF